MQYNNPYSAYANLPVQPSAPVYQQQTPTYMNMQQPVQQMQVMPQQNIQMPTRTETLNDGGFIVVPNEESVRTYPIAPGNFVTFKIDGQPIVIEKSMSRSQFASPTYKKYRLSEINMDDNTPVDKADTVTTTATSDVDYKADFEDIKNGLNDIKSQMDSLKGLIKASKNNNADRKFDRKDGEK